MTKLSTIVWLAISACAVPAYVIADSYRHIDIVKGAEDDCAYYYGAYALDDVIGHDGYVVCRYRGF